MNDNDDKIESCKSKHAVKGGLEFWTIHTHMASMYSYGIS